jgi:phosphoadenosine phosphosulfate reductase
MLDGFTLSDMEAEAIAYLRLNEPAEGYEVGFSGGKDSIVTLDLVRRSGVKHHAHFAMSYIDPPEVLSFIRQNYPDVEWRRPKVNIYHAILTKGLPSWKHRWCCELIKENGSDKNVVTGIRAEESQRRASRPRTDFIKKTKVMMYKPVFDWSEWAIWEYIEKHHLPFPSLYEDFGRIGCVVCPLSFGPYEASKLRIKKSMERWPGIWRAYKDAAYKYYARYRTKCDYYKTFEDMWNAFLDGFRRA